MSFVDRFDLQPTLLDEDARWLHALAAAEKGLAWLQEHGAEHNLDWLRINVAKVRVASDVDCPLGQASSYPMFFGKGSYVVTMGRLIKAGVIPWRDRDLWAYRHGFHDWGMAGEYIPYYVLTKAWKQVLTEAHQREEVAAA